MTVNRHNLKIKRTYLIQAAVFFLLFVMTGFLIRRGAFSGFDNAAGTYIRSLASDTATGIFMGLTILGKVQVLAVILIPVCCFLAIRQKAGIDGLVLFLSLAGTALLQGLLKSVFQRPRPEVARLVEAAGYSFPSAHVLMSAAFYWVLGYLICRHLKARPKTRRYILFAMAAVVASISVSRVYLGVHYPSDVIGSVALGGFWANACMIIGDVLKGLVHRSSGR